MGSVSEIMHSVVELGVTGWKAVLSFIVLCFAWSFHEWIGYKKQLKEKDK